VTAARRPESQEQILQATAASLTEADIPPEDQDGWLDRDTDSPAELAALPDAELEELLAAAPPRPAPPAWPLSYRSIGGPGGERWPAGPGPRDDAGGGAGFASGMGAGFADGIGAGFADGGPLDVLAAGAALGGLADDAHAGLAALTDDELIGVLRAWRRQTSWAQARELAAVAELARRRPTEGTPPASAPGAFPAKLSEFTGDEVAAALTLTGRAAGSELDLALDLAARPATAAALETGQIDLPRAKILTGLLGPLSAAHADAVEAQILPRAAGMTTGQLRAALRRAVLSVDPEAARRRREDAEREARVEHRADPEGTATLAGRGLPPAAALTAGSRLTQIAAAWKKHGAQGGMDLLRAHAYLALLNGHSVDLPPAGLLPPDLVPGPPRPPTAPPPTLAGTARRRPAPATAPPTALAGTARRRPALEASPLAAGSRRPAPGADRPTAGQLPIGSTSRPGCAAPARAARRRLPG
jgi:Domain of unknown function (DUF222)